MSPPYIDCFLRPGAWFHARPSSSKRKWMDATPHQHAYRCLPLLHANQHGWEILLKQSFIAQWNGGPTQQDLTIELEGTSPDGSAPIVSAFGSGIITFHIPCLFSTPKDVNLWVSGLPNSFKDGVQPLSAVVETDWYQESGFTMNWKITRPNHPIRFELHEPICFFFPIPRGYVESFQPRLRSFDSDSKRKETYFSAEDRRRTFQEDLSITQVQETMIPGAEQKKQWQRHYFEGKKPDGSTAHGHQTKLHIKPFQIEDI